MSLKIKCLINFEIFYYLPSINQEIRALQEEKKYNEEGENVEDGNSEMIKERKEEITLNKKGATKYNNIYSKVPF